MLSRTSFTQRGIERIPEEARGGEDQSMDGQSALWIGGRAALRAVPHCGHLDRLSQKCSHQEPELWLARQDFLLYRGQVAFWWNMWGAQQGVTTLRGWMRHTNKCAPPPPERLLPATPANVPPPSPERLSASGHTRKCAPSIPSPERLLLATPENVPPPPSEHLSTSGHRTCRGEELPQHPSIGYKQAIVYG